MKNFFFFTGGIKINKIRILILATLILTLSSCVGAATEYTVNSGSKIQDAVNLATSGDIITIGPGTYTENVLISSKSNLLIRSSAGPASTIIANNTGTNVITLQSCTNVTIQGLTVTGAGTDNAGIYVFESNYCKVEGNILHDDALGIYLKGSQNTIVRSNTATKDTLPGTGRAINVERSPTRQSKGNTVSSNTVSNQRYGIYVSSSQDSTISENTVNLSADNGIVVEGSSTGITVGNNNLNSNRLYGIYLYSSGGNFLRSNKVFNSTNGINIVSSSGNEITSNTIWDSSIDSLTHGIFLNTSNSNLLQNNEISKTDYGIAIRYSNSNSVVNNNAHNNNKGIYFTLTATGNTISGNQANSNNNNGIILDNSGSNSLINNTARLNNDYGIYLSSSSNNVLTNNIASENGRGIYITSLSSENRLSGNTMNSNSGDGIRLESAGINNNLSSNTISSNGNYGIYLVNSNNSRVLNNIAPGNSKGIYVVTTSGSTISNNNVSDNNADGIMLSLSSNNTVSGNTAYKNDQYGISLNSSRSNTISSNFIASSGTAGMFLCPQSTNNVIYDNYLNNIHNTDNKNSGSKWNTTKTSGKNIMGGPYIGGNYWANPTFNDGFSQTASDADHDGIADAIYSYDNFVDYLPLVYIVLPDADFTSNVSNGKAPLSVKFTDKSKYATEWSWDFDNDGFSDSKIQNPVYVFTVPKSYTVKLIASNQNGTDTQIAVITVTENIPPVNIHPVANFSPSTTSGYAPLLVTFTDLSQNATEWKWDFGDGATSTLPSPTHTYSEDGKYTVNLTVSNGNNFASKYATINVYSNGGGRSGGGGGGGGSPEPARNVEVKELSQTFITNGKAVKFDFTKNATCVVYVGFDAKKTVGKTTTIAEQLKNKSTLVSSLSEGEVYKYFNVWVGNSGFATSTNIDNPTICFKVAKSWIQDKKIDKDSIILNRYSDKKWEQLPTSLLNEDSKYLYFTADVPGYSFFAITGKINATPEKTETEIQPNDSDNSEDMENTSSEANQESGGEENTGMPGFEVVYGVAGLLAVFLYKRK